MPVYAFKDYSHDTNLRIPSVTLIRNAYPRPPKTDLAADLLVEMLEFGTMPVSDIEAVMLRKGIGKETAQRAGQRLGVVQGYENGVPVWKL